MRSATLSKYISAIILSLHLHSGGISAAQESYRETVLSVFAGEWVSRALYTAAKLEVADHLQNGPKPISELAALTHSNEDSLARTLCLLSSHGIFEEVSQGIFANNDASRLLIKSAPDSLHALSVFYGEEIHAAWPQVIPSVQSGKPAFDLTFKQPVFGYFKSCLDRAALFQQAMKEKSRAVIASALDSYNFGRFNSFCDIGGGYGQFIAALLCKYPQASGEVFELPEVVEKIRLQTPDLENDRCRLVAGDFFETAPQGKDLYLMKSVIHDWDDAKAAIILKNCREAMRPDSRLLLVEVVLQPGKQGSYAHCMDFLMMAITGGKERTLASMTRLLEDSGLAIVEIYPTATEFSLIEVKIQ